jgi:Protein of unknown function (DUF3099)
VVTEARLSRSADISYRERRYLIMMSIRLVCFVIAVVLFINGAGWLTAIPAVGAIIIPYFAVIFANGGREPNGSQGFRPYEPNLPDRFTPDSSTGANGGRPEPGVRDSGSGESGPRESAAGESGRRESAAGESGPRESAAGESGPRESGPRESGTAGNHGESGRTS